VAKREGVVVRKVMIVVLLTAVSIVAAAAPASAHQSGQIRSSTARTQAEWVCIGEEYAQGIPLATALDDCAVSLVGPDGTKFGSGIADPYGGVLGSGDAHYYSDVTVACGSGDSRIGNDGGTPASKAEIDKMMMAAWKEYLQAMFDKDLQAAQNARDTYDKLKTARGYAPDGRTGPLNAEQCQQLQEAARALDQQIQRCDADGWQSSYDCRALAAVLFHCADPTVSLTTGDYSCGGKPTKSELQAAADQAYLLCSELRRGVDPSADPCKAVTSDKNLLQAVLYERDKCHDPYALWSENCATPVDLDAALAAEVAKVTPGFHDALIQLCKVAGGPACLGPPTGDDPAGPPGPGPRPGPGGPK
jgi:hypothetical protein